MDDPSLSGIAITLLLIIIHALITLLYAAFNNVRQGWMKDQADEDNAGAAKVLDLITNANKLFVVIQIIHVLLRFSIATIVILNVVNPILAHNTTMNEPLAYAIALAITALVTLIIGEIVPESIGSAYANALALWTAGFMTYLLVVFSPLVTAILFVSRFLSSLVGGGELVNTVTEEEIMTLVDAGHSGGTIEEEEKDMIFSVLQLDQTHASEVMIPRIDMVAIDIEKSLDEAGELFIQSGYSRIPVYEENIDQIRGVLYAKDLLAYLYQHDNQQDKKTIHDMMRHVSFVPETRPADELLKELQLRKVHLAIVQDEYGGTSGLVTIENLIEEIIGDIRDEYDDDEEAEYEQLGADEYIMDASIDLDDVNNMLEVDLPSDDNDTLGGYIYTYFERIPAVDEVIEDDDLIIRVQSVDGRRIRKVHVIRKRPQEDGDAPDEDASDEDTSKRTSPQIVERRTDD